MRGDIQEVLSIAILLAVVTVQPYVRVEAEIREDITDHNVLEIEKLFKFTVLAIQFIYLEFDLNLLNGLNFA
jgi:hypothetical protein